MNFSEKFNWNLVSRFRSEIMGVAIILVVICHSDAFSWGKIQLYINEFMKVFAIGVDIFLFVSGIGLYFSMKKNSDVFCFYKKRFLRIIPEFLIISIAGSVILDFALSKIVQLYRGGGSCNSCLKSLESKLLLFHMLVKMACCGMLFL